MKHFSPLSSLSNSVPNALEKSASVSIIRVNCLTVYEEFLNKIKSSEAMHAFADIQKSTFFFVYAVKKATYTLERWSNHVAM